MNTLINILGLLVSLPKMLLVPLVIFLLAVVVRTKLSVALKGALLVGAGLTGILAINDMVVEVMGPVATGLVSVLGLQNDILDLGMSVMFGAVTSLPIFIFIYPIGIVTNLILISIRWTKTLMVDFLNFFTLLIPALPVWFMTHNILWTLIVVVINLALMLKIADWTAPMVKDYYKNVEGISIPHASCGFQAIYVIPLNWLLDRIPLIKDIDINLADAKQKMGILGEPSVIGMILGTLLGIAAGLGIPGGLEVGITFVAAMLIFPKAVGLMMEGLTPISKTMREFMVKQFNIGDLYMGMDAAIFCGYPEVIASTSLFIPIAILLHFILPGVRVLPGAESITLLITVMGMIVPFAGKDGKKGNIFRSLVIATILSIVGLYLMTYMAPLVTELCNTTGFTIPGEYATSFAIRDPQIGFVYWIMRLLGFEV